MNDENIPYSGCSLPTDNSYYLLSTREKEELFKRIQNLEEDVKLLMERWRAMCYVLTPKEDDEIH